METDTSRYPDSIGVFLAPAEYVDSDNTDIQAHAGRLATGRTPRHALIEIFRFVRDIPYGAPDFDRLASFRASDLISRGRGYCVPKACALAALARAAGMPARLGFADVSNHLASPRTVELMGSRTFAWHGYTEVLLDGRWIKLSPTFDAELCTRMGVPVLEFDGVADAHLPAFDPSGRTFMQYERLHGEFHDVPARFLANEMPRLYPRMCAAIRAGVVH
ncbi:transglutaminase domain-containing protein [Phenylobacterium terrae]|uniref:Transglutaminase domain-containing protein n=2 Tax=Phenylobacterium terrae TaxID=2665495 RepID=A0ABW4N682_9CAUL